jgi:hypothetical protein
MDKTAIIIALIAAFTGSGISSIIVVLLQGKWAKQDQHDERVDALVDATKVQMIDRVRSLGREYIKTGEIHLEDKENLKEMYTAYKRLGGNGHLDTIMCEVDHLKVV